MGGDQGGIKKDNRSNKDSIVGWRRGNCQQDFPGTRKYISQIRYNPIYLNPADQF
jgi:hypothetical protein